MQTFGEKITNLEYHNLKNQCSVEDLSIYSAHLVVVMVGRT